MIKGGRLSLVLCLVNVSAKRDLVQVPDHVLGPPTEPRPFAHIFCTPISNIEQVQVKKPHRSRCTAYHGLVTLASCVSTAGLAIQETKGLMPETYMQPRDQETRSHTKTKNTSSPFPGNDDHSSTTETRLASSESDDGSTHAEGGAWGKRKLHDTRTKGCCTVNVTTTFVPHVVRPWKKITTLNTCILTWIREY